MAPANDGATGNDDVVEMGRSAHLRHSGSSRLHGGFGSAMAGHGRHHGPTGQGEIHLPPCDRKVVMAQPNDELGDEVVAA